jgi:hypothetical protein
MNRIHTERLESDTSNRSAAVDALFREEPDEEEDDEEEDEDKDNEEDDDEGYSE